MKPRILLVNESAVLNTGYSVYGREVLSRLHATGKYEIAELACYVDRFDARLNSIPWRVYPNLPDHAKEPEHKSQEKDVYESQQGNAFGEFRFDEVCRDFRPHIVFAIRDFWMDQYLNSSPYRNKYNLTLLAPVDSRPQNEQWLALYGAADAIFSYTDWGIKTLKEQTNNGMNIISEAPAIAAQDFFPLPPDAKEKIKADLGLSDYKIVGFVSRNQKRKLFPDLFDAFRKFLDKTQRNDVLLYCHTSYPDVGWDIPKLLLQYGLCSKVLFTYVCTKCHEVTPSFFSGPMKSCPLCNNLSVVSNVEIGVNNQSLNIIYNLMDLYVQIATNEGFGMAQTEAAACAVPVISTDYSAMEDVLRKVNGFPLPVKTLYLEAETGAFKAVPDVDYLAQFFDWFFSQNEDTILELKKLAYEGFHTNYGDWSRTAKKWEDYFDSVDVSIYESKWTEPKQFRNPAQLPENIDQMSNGEYVEWALKYVLCDSSKIGSYMHLRLIRDLNVGFTKGGLGGLYYNEWAYEHGIPKNAINFDRKTIYHHLLDLVHRYNMAEDAR